MNDRQLTHYRDALTEINATRARISAAALDLTNRGIDVPTQAIETIISLDRATSELSHALVDVSPTRTPATRTPALRIRIEPNTRGPVGLLADAEIHFCAGPLDGLRLIGFGVWQRRSGDGQNVTFPARTYQQQGERRSYAVLRPQDDTRQQDAIRGIILDAFERHMASPFVVSRPTDYSTWEYDQDGRPILEATAPALIGSGWTQIDTSTPQETADPVTPALDPTPARTDANAAHIRETAADHARSQATQPYRATPAAQAIAMGITLARAMGETAAPEMTMQPRARRF